MPLTKKTIEVGLCDYPVNRKPCLKEAPGDPVHASYEGNDFAGYLCPQHLSTVNKMFEPFLSMAPGRPRTRRASTAGGRARVTGVTTSPRARTRKVAKVTGPAVDITDGSPNGAKVPASAEVRRWMKAQGRDMSARGRIPSRIVKEYLASKMANA